MDINHLQFLSENAQDHLKTLLNIPVEFSFSDLSLKEFSSSIEKIRSNLSAQGLLNLLDLNLLTAFLIQKQIFPEWYKAWLQNNTDIPLYFNMDIWESAIKGKWIAVPVFLVHGKDSYIRYFITGKIQGTRNLTIWPEWTDRLLDESSKKAVNNAVKSAIRITPLPKDQILLCYPLTDPCRVLVTGGSLGVPLALGFLSLLNKESLSKAVASTGKIDENGKTGHVNHLKQKIRHAQDNGFKLMLHPGKSHFPTQIETLEISRIEEAFMFSVLYTPGKAGEFKVLSESLNNPDVFCNNCHEINIQWLKWAYEKGRLKNIIDRISESGKLFDNFVRRIKSCINSEKLEKASILASMICENHIQTITDHAPAAFFNFCDMNLLLANRKGDVCLAEKWSNRAEKVISKYRGINTSERSDHYNYKFMTLHNKYVFKPELPEEFKIFLQSYENQYADLCSISPVSVELGRLFGAVAQNYGFCGPEFLDKTIKYAQMARTVFSCEQALELKSDSLRQLNYMIYALLDAGKKDEAQKKLITYLEIEKTNNSDLSITDQTINRLSSYEHAVLARFFADCPEHESKVYYFNRVSKRFDFLIKAEHPWQLWAYNLGRIARSLNNIFQASLFYSKSLELCLDKEKFMDTVRVMGLLPLSGLWEINKLPDKKLNSIKSTIYKSARSLNPEYFKNLMSEHDINKIFENIRNCPEKLFPFSYR